MSVEQEENCPIDMELELEAGTVVRLRSFGEWTLKPEGGIDLPFFLEFVERGAMEKDEVERQARARYYEAMEPVLMAHPETAAHIATGTPPAPRRRMHH